MKKLLLLFVIFILSIVSVQAAEQFRENSTGSLVELPAGQLVLELMRRMNIIEQRSLGVEDQVNNLRVEFKSLEDGMQQMLENQLDIDQIIGVLRRQITSMQISIGNLEQEIRNESSPHLNAADLRELIQQRVNFLNEYARSQNDRSNYERLS